MKIVQSQTKRFAVLTRTWVRAFGGKWLVQPTRCLRRARQLLNQWNNYINETIISFLCHCHISNTNLQKKRDVWAVRMNGFHPKTWFLYKSVGQRNVRATRFCSHQNTNLVKFLRLMAEKKETSIYTGMNAGSRRLQESIGWKPSCS